MEPSSASCGNHGISGYARENMGGGVIRNRERCTREYLGFKDMSVHRDILGNIRGGILGNMKRCSE